VRVEGAGTGVDHLRIGGDGRNVVIRIIGATIGVIKVTLNVTIRDVVIDVDATAVGIPGADGVMAVLVEDVVLDINAIEREPENNAVGAVEGHDIVVNFHIGDGVIAGHLKAVGGVGKEDVVKDDLVFAAKVQAVVQVAAGAAVVVNVIGAINVAAGCFVGVDAVVTLSAGAGGISVVVDVAVEDLVIVGPNRDATFGAILDFKAVDDVVAAVDLDSDVAIGSV
jgi:hypothetical protein